ncbi:hypothetical protein EQG49_03465 [Periweissella cryptocerci]|uniref:YfhO family protein n=1 Tax=Periweissella cryptocerci TaxID=2506420 RepID=A0A4P6YSH3_9LACO|nr:hypothetical protein EQG49_03465 [Periweissella cryptocerci]
MDLLKYGELNKYTKQHGVWLTIMLVVTMGLTFGLLLLSGTSLVAQGDSFNQHINVYAQFHQYLVEFLQHPKAFGTWDWRIANGSDWFNTFSYYIVGDPFGYLMLFFNRAHTLLGYEIIVLLRFVAAAFAFNYLAAKFKFSPKIAALGSTLYVFSAFGIYSTLVQPLFMNAMIILPLLLVLVERYFTTKKGLWLSVVIALAFTSNFYWAIILAIIVGIYALTTYLINYCNTKWLFDWAQLIGYIVLGVGLSAVLLWPTMTMMSQSSRVGTGFENLTVFYPLRYYVQLLSMPLGLKNTISPSIYWIQGSVSGLSLIGTIWLIVQRKQLKVQARMMFIVYGLLLFPITSVLMSLGNLATNRWMFFVNMLTSFGAMHLLTNRKSVTASEKGTFVKILAGYLIVLAVSNIFFPINNYSVYTQLIGLVIFTLLIFNPGKGKWVKHETLFAGFFVGMLVLTVGSQLYDPLTYSSVSLLRTQTVKQRTSNPTGYNKFFANLATPAQHKTGTNQLIKVTQAVGYLLPRSRNSMLNIFPGDMYLVNDYYSTLPASMVDFGKNQLRLPNYREVAPIGSADNRFVVASYLGADYILANRKTSLSKIKQYVQVDKNIAGKSILLKNTMAQPVAYWMAANKAYDAPDALSKYSDTLLLTNVGVNDKRVAKNATQMTKMANISIAKPVDYKTQRLNGTKVMVKPINIDTAQVMIKYRKGMKVQLPATLTAGLGETHVYVDELHFKALSNVAQAKLDARRLSVKHWQGKYIATRHVLLDFHKTFGMQIEANNSKRVAHLEQAEPSKGAMYEKRDKATFNLGITNKPLDYIRFLFNRDGTYTFKLRIARCDLNQNVLQGIKTNQQNAMTVTRADYSGMTGMVNKSKAGYLVTNIPYSNGWRATVNDHVIKIERVNNDFIGLKVASGANKIKLKYQTPGLKLGIITSLLSLLVVLLIAIVGIKRRKK